MGVFQRPTKTMGACVLENPSFLGYKHCILKDLNHGNLRSSEEPQVEADTNRNRGDFSRLDHDLDQKPSIDLS